MNPSNDMLVSKITLPTTASCLARRAALIAMRPAYDPEEIRPRLNLMINFRFGQDDLLRTRFAIAPLMELAGCVYALRDPARVAVHRPWAEWARPRTAHLELSLLDVATPSK